MSLHGEPKRLKRVPVRITQTDGEIRVIGFTEGKRFVTYRREKDHLYRGGLPTVKEAKKAGVAAWGIDEKACDGLIRHGIEQVLIIADRRRYTCQLADFVSHEKAFVLHFKPHRAQRFLPLDVFQTESRVEPTDRDTIKLIKEMSRNGRLRNDSGEYSGRRVR